MKARDSASGRAERWAQLRDGRRWDLVVIGGGATGLGVALDAAARGLSVACVEAHDFAKGTSSRATKLVHGGVRYLAQGNVALVREALHERATLLANAPHLAQKLPFVMPSYHAWQKLFYGTGLKMYDALAGARGLGGTEFLSAARAKALLPGVRTKGLVGGVRYWDGQFDDARLALALARTALREGAVVMNHCSAIALQRDGTRVTGVIPRALAKREVAHAGLSELFVVDTMHERKAKMAALSRAFIALPGGYGTLEELAEVVTWIQLGIHQKPLALLDVSGFWQPYLGVLDHFAREGFVNAEERKLVIHDADPERLVTRLTELSVSRPPIVGESDL